MHDIDRIYQKMEAAGLSWSDKEAAASLLEETRRSVRAKLALQSESNSVAKAEMLAESHEEYKAHIESMVKARQEANRAKVKYDSAKVWVELHRTKEATARAAMKLA